LGNVADVLNYYEEFRNIDDPDAVCADLDQYFDEMSSYKFHFILVIIKVKNDSKYPYIKRAAELEVEGGVLTQCVASQNVQRAQGSTIGNVLLKLNMKLGGINNFLYINDDMLSRINILNAPVMIMGADVTHPSPGSEHPSFAAVTASTDRTGMPFMMHCQAQTKEERDAAEIIENLDVIVHKMLVKFIKNTNHRPRKILFYRDGVGDSQFSEVLQKEMMAIRQGCIMLENDTYAMGLATGDRALKDQKLYQPKITFIAVQKRHKTRFFPMDSKDAVGRPQNAPPGTIVDTQIVSASRTDFYLLSHTGIQGTSRPTRYQVLWDDSEFSVDEIQVLTYYLCYCFCRCNRSVSYPAPTYYAHLAATRAKVFATTFGEEFYGNVPLLNEKIERQAELLKLNPIHFV
jgi:eukaryotic translation initiation factor 2C